MLGLTILVLLLMLLSGLAVIWCIVFCLIHFFRLIKLGKVKDLSQKSGNVKEAIIYSNTTAMLPTQKESAYKHLPTYTAGIIYHIGTFLSLLFFIIFFVLFPICSLFFTSSPIVIDSFWSDGGWFFACMACFLLVSFSCGLSLFLKRLFSEKLRPISNFDDYFSNAIVTLFQLFTAILFVSLAISRGHIFGGEEPLFLKIIGDISVLCYFPTAIILFLYLPFGKLKHAVYYFAARYHLGFFYGWRNTWKPKKEKQ